MNGSIKAVLLAAMNQFRGDDLERARNAFRGCTPQQMDEQYGLSGRTRAQIIAEYEAHVAKVNETREWVERNAPGVGGTDGR